MKPMLRDYKVWAFSFKQRLQIRESNGAGELEFKGMDPELTLTTRYFIATSAEAAEWFGRRFQKYTQDFEFVSVEEVCRIDGALWEENA